MSPEHIGQQIRQARKAAGITQEQLASTLHVSRQTVSNWENARSQPDYQMLQALASLLHMNLAELFGAPPAEETPAAEDAEAPEPSLETASAQIVQSAPEAAPVPQVVQPEAQVQDAPPVVQPAARKPFSARFPLFLLTAALAVVFLGTFAVYSRSNAQVYTRSWFEKERVPTAGQSFIDVSTKYDAVPLFPATSDLPPRYYFDFFLRETQGIGFQPELVRFLFFFENGNIEEVCVDKAALVRHQPTSSHINAYGVMRVEHGYELTGGDVPLGVGCVVEGTDDHNNRLAFGRYVPFSAE